VITEPGKRRNKQTFVPLFLLKETEEVKDKNKATKGRKRAEPRG
jgi:hypothetical protein